MASPAPSATVAPLTTPSSNAAAAGKTPAGMAAASPVPPSAAGTSSPGNGSSPSKQQGGHRQHTFGVLRTGYLEKMNPARLLDTPKKRFVVLTHMGIHWFKRADGQDLFGEERGCISVQDICKVELVRVPGGNHTNDHPSPACASTPATAGSNHASVLLDAFEVSCKQDVVRRVFRASSPEEAAAWAAAVKAAIKARSLYRRETLNGISFSPHGGAHDGAAAAQEEAPLVSVVTLKRPGHGHEVVLAKGPDYRYGHLFELAYTIQAPSSTVGADDAEGGVLCVLLSNGDSAEMAVRALVSKPVGETVQAKVQSLGGHSAHLPLTIEAAAEAKATEEEAPKAGGGEAAAVLTALDVLVPVVCALAVGAWTHAEMASTAATATMALPSMSKDRLALLTLLGLLLLRRLVAWANKCKKAEAPAGAAERRMVLKLSIDDYVHDARLTAAAAIGAEEQDGEELQLPPIPKRFVDGCFGDMVEAERRWRVTLAWRNDFGTDGILEQEHPYYDLIKEALPHFYCKTGKDGNPVYYERSGQTDLAKARRAGIDWLVWHYIHSTEFLFRRLYPSEQAKTITIFDVQGLGMKDIAGEPLEFIRRATHLMQEHYPERCKVIIIANTPAWFSFIWRMIKPLVNETTQKKVRIVPAGKQTTAAIAEFVELKDIPVEYGGELQYGDEADSCRWHSPEEEALKAHVYAVNKRFAEERAARGVSPPERFEPPHGARGGK